MGSQDLSLAQQYYAGSFQDSIGQSLETVDLSAPGFEATDKNFHENYDDWYRAHYAHYGDKVDAVKAMVMNAIVAFKQTYGHMKLCYKNCAISSGTNPNLDAVIYGHHTSDKLARVIGSEEHTWHNIIDNSLRSLARAHKVHPLYPEMYIVTPSAFEGSTRVLGRAGGHKLTGGLTFDGADYMAFWNMVIDSCEGFILDDICRDMPSKERVLKEIELAQNYSEETRSRLPIQTSDWVNSRNSILEMARGNYIRFGLHPLRPDAQMDMRLYDEESDSLYAASLLDCIKPAVQHILRWAPQGIATEEACRTVARLINLHRMRTDPQYNAEQAVPLDLRKLDPLLRDPSQEEIHELKRLIESVEPFLLRYCAHLIRSEGLPEKYAKAKEAHPVKVEHLGNDITNGKEIVKWQRANIPAGEVAALWDLTLPRELKPEEAFEKRPPIHGAYQPARRKHSYEAKDAPFALNDVKEIWPDRPFDHLDEMYQDLARYVMGVLETGILPLDSPDYHGARFDMKRGLPAMRQAEKHGLTNLSLLPGVLGSEFTQKVGKPNQEDANENVQRLRVHQLEDGSSISAAVFGTPQVQVINYTVNALRQNFTGPGSQSANSDFRLALEMEMLRRYYTKITFQDGWEASEDSTRMMLQATKIELGKIKRPGDNHTELSVLAKDGHYISFYERYEALRGHLDRLLNDPQIQNYIATGNHDAQKDLGVRHTSLALARLIEAYDCLIDPLFSEGRFEAQIVENQNGFFKDLEKIFLTRSEAMKSILKNWVWLWSDEDFKGLRQDYRDAWLEAHGEHARRAGPDHTDDQAFAHRFGA